MVLRSYLRFARSLVLRDRPVYVHYAVTSRCNLRCRACTIWRRQENELTCDEVGELAAMVARLGCVQVSLGGGEPSLRPDLPEILGHFRSRRIRTRVLTNGVAMTPPIGEALVRAGMREVSFSLDSLEPDVSDDLDNVGSTYHQRIRNLLALARALPRRGVLPVLNTVVTRRNLDELIDIVDFAGELGFHVSLIPVHVAGTAEHRFYSDDDQLQFRPADEPRLRDVYDRVLRARSRGARIINSTAFLERSPDYLLGRPVDWPCRAGEQFLSVSPDGSASPCHAFEGDRGIPFRQLEATMGSEDYRAVVRQRVASCEGCFRPCWAEIGLMMGGPRSLAEMAGNQLRAYRRRPRVHGEAIAHHLGLDGSAER